eukprot:5275738-Heterocapsa_arctica.AAC.1
MPGKLEAERRPDHEDEQEVLIADLRASAQRCQRVINVALEAHAIAIDAGRGDAQQEGCHAAPH